MDKRRQMAEMMMGFDPRGGMGQMGKGMEQTLPHTMDASQLPPNMMIPPGAFGDHPGQPMPGGMQMGQEIDPAYQQYIMDLMQAAR